MKGPSNQVSYLREKAKQFREMAKLNTPLSPKLREMAEEFEKRATEIENRGMA